MHLPRGQPFALMAAKRPHAPAHFEILQVLREMGADFKITDSKGESMRSVLRSRVMREVNAAIRLSEGGCGGEAYDLSDSSSKQKMTRRTRRPYDDVSK